MRWFTFFSALLVSASVFADAVFEAQTIDDRIAIGYGLAIGDVDGDKKPDILLADQKEIVWYRNPDWTRYVMVANVTQKDNVCIAARDIDGDGKVEVAIGANWNPGDTVGSGSVHVLIRPENADHAWSFATLVHEPTVHRMHWVRCGDGKFRLIVKPLHGKGNKNGEGVGGKTLSYEPPALPLNAENAKKEWKTEVVFDGMNITHNFDPYPLDPAKADSVEGFIIGGKQGLRRVTHDGKAWKADVIADHAAPLKGVGEVRQLQQGVAGNGLIATVEPFHGNQLCVYVPKDGKYERFLIDETFKEAHALAFAPMTETGENNIIVGWRMPSASQKVGIAIFYPAAKTGEKWRREVVDDNGMATEDLKVADLNGDGKLEIIAAGRATKNLKVYWNKTK